MAQGPEIAIDRQAHNQDCEPLGAVSCRQVGNPEPSEHYLTICRHLLDLALSRAIPIMIFPRPSTGMKGLSGTGFVLKIGSDAVLVTANHVFEGFKQKHWSRPEDWHWIVGKLPPFDPTERVRYTDRGKDIVFLRLTADETQAVCGNSSEVIEPRLWPPPLPVIGDAVVMAGYPGDLREVRPGKSEVGAGAAKTILRVKSAYGDNSQYLCELDFSLNYGGQLPPADYDLGGISGGPVFKMEEGAAGILQLALVGVIVECSRERIVFSALADLPAR